MNKLKRSFIYDHSLVLYLPLWYLDGSQFMSRDAYGHLITKNGAFWSPRGQSFDGVDDKLTVPDHNSLDFTTAFTLAAVMKPEQGTDQHFISKHTSTKTGYFFHLPATDTIRCAIGNGTAWEAAASSSVLLMNSWQLIVATFDSSYIRLYHNAREVASNAAVGPIAANTQDMWIGADITNPGFYMYKGSIAEIYAFSRSFSYSELVSFYLHCKSKMPVL